jgi:hypothetical protein
MKMTPVGYVKNNEDGQVQLKDVDEKYFNALDGLNDFSPVLVLVAYEQYIHDI